MNPFRNSTNTRYTKALFLEENTTDRSTVLYTLKQVDHLGYPSLYRLYMEVGDPTEYAFASQYLDGWEHWQLLTQCEWFKPYLASWRQELEVKIRSEALACVRREAKSLSKNSYSANKVLLEGGWKPKTGSATSRGRPSKDEVTKQAVIEAERKTRVNQDYERMQLNGNGDG